MGDTKAEPMSDSEFERELEKIRKDYVASLPAKVTELKNYASKFAENSADRENTVALRNLAHAIAGSSALFGIEHASEKAKTLEHELDGIVDNVNGKIEASRLSRVQTLTSELTAALNRRTETVKSAQKASPESEAQHKKTVFIIDDDEHVASYLSAHISKAGYRVKALLTLASARKALADERPDLIISDIMFPDDAYAGVELVDELRSLTHVRTPVIFISSRTDTETRLRAMNAGCDAYFTKPIDETGLITKIQTLLRQDDALKPRVLMVDDDEHVTAHFTTVLTKNNINARAINDPMRTMDEIEAFKPNLLILDLNMPAVSGLDLSRILRQDEKTVGIPIVYFSSETDPKIHEEALGIGGEIFLTKPISDERFSVEIERFLQRSAKVRSAIDQISQNDPDTGMSNRKYFLTQLDESINNSNAQEAPRWLIQIQIDQYGLVREKIGYSDLDRVLSEVAKTIKGEFPAAANTCHFGESVFAVLSGPQPQDVTEQQAKKVRAALAKMKMKLDWGVISLTSSVAAVPLTDAQTTVKALLNKVGAALDTCQRGGGNCSQFISTTTRKNEAVDESKIIDLVKRRKFTLRFQSIINVGDEYGSVFELKNHLRDESGHAWPVSHYADIARKQGLSTDIDRHIVQEAMSTLAKLPPQTPKTTLIIPFLEFSRGFSSWLESSIRFSGFRSSHRIVIELDESIVAANKDEIGKFIDELKQLKFGVALGGYGTTKFSRSLISDFSFDYARINDARVNQAPHDHHIQTEFRNLVERARVSHAAAIVSQMENARTISIFWTWGVRYFQGVFVQEPMAELQYSIDNTIVL